MHSPVGVTDGPIHTHTHIFGIQNSLDPRLKLHLVLPTESFSSVSRTLRITLLCLVLFYCLSSVLVSPWSYFLVPGSSAKEGQTEERHAYHSVATGAMRAQRWSQSKKCHG